MNLSARAALPADEPPPGSAPLGRLDQVAWGRTCFYSTPIGEAGTEWRRHSDVFLDQLVRPAIAAVDPAMRVIRADELSSNMILTSVFKCVKHSRLFVADLSFHNANVLHEVGMRHMANKPCVLISRIADEIPANLRDLRVVRVNTSELYEFAGEIPLRRNEITAHANWALSPDGEASGPGPAQREFPA